MKDTDFTDRDIRQVNEILKRKQDKAARQNNIPTAGQVVDGLAKQYTSGQLCELPSTQCLKCGRTVYFSKGQWRKACPGCGMFIIAQGVTRPEEKRNFDCWICLERGFVVYRLQSGNNLYVHAARCTCEHGKRYGGMPCIDTVQSAPTISSIVMANRMKYAHKK